MYKTAINWPERFALIKHYSPSDEQVCQAFGLSQDELDTARQLQQAGTFGISSNVDVAQYANVFSGAQVTNGTASVKAKGAASFSRPETASKKVKVAQKRGRKGDKIARALQAVPMTQVPIDSFIAQHGVSLAVLRQAKRFMEKMPPDQVAAIGTVKVRQDKATKKLVIWREAV